MSGPSPGLTVAVMQPYFFPYLGYFSLIRAVDRFILFDPVQYIRHGWIDRNRILKHGEGWLYIRPAIVKHGHDALIKDVAVDNTQPWQSKLLSQLQTYKRIAPHYWPVRKLMEEVLATPHQTVVALNKATLEAVCTYLGMPRSFEVFSEMVLDIEPPRAADEWALHICQALGNVRAYWNPPGGESFFDRSKYEAAGIELRFHKAVLEPYDQRRQPFEPGLSILDVLMFNPPETVLAMLDRYELH